MIYLHSSSTGKALCPSLDGRKIDGADAVDPAQVNVHAGIVSHS